MSKTKNWIIWGLWTMLVAYESAHSPSPDGWRPFYFIGFCLIVIGLRCRVAAWLDEK